MNNGSIRSNIKEGLNVGIVFKAGSENRENYQGRCEENFNQLFEPSSRDQSSANRWAGWQGQGNLLKV
jgi:nitrous oxidase accessory protein NosD